MSDPAQKPPLKLAAAPGAGATGPVAVPAAPPPGGKPGRRPGQIPRHKAVPRPVAAPARRARLRLRHVLAIFSFLIMVAAPSGAALWYLGTRAADQYASTVGFSVQREEATSPLEILGGITQISGTSSDTDILYEFLQSQRLVADLDAELDLRARWSRPQNDPYFSFDPDGTIEDLVDYWQKMVSVHYNGGGMIEIRVLAFTAADANAIATALFNRSSDMINALSSIAREDTIRYARAELTAAESRLRDAREAVTRFRNLNQLVSPEMDLQVQAGLLGTLQTQLAESLIDVDMLGDTLRADDSRLTQAQRRVEVIETRIEAERQKLGMSGGEGSAYADLVGEYERLSVDRELAERVHASASAAYDTALADAQRQSRYLAAYIEPTLAESPRFPERETLWVLVTLFACLTWSISMLVAWSLKDRR